MTIKIKKGSSATWEMFGQISPKLGFYFYAFCEKLREYQIDTVTITSIIRPKDTIDGETGIHSLGRAIDLSVSNIPEKVLNDVVTWMNNKYTYSITRPKLNVAIVHDVGAGRHVHIQCEN